VEQRNAVGIQIRRCDFPTFGLAAYDPDDLAAFSFESALLDRPVNGGAGDAKGFGRFRKAVAALALDSCHNGATLTKYRNGCKPNYFGPRSGKQLEFEEFSLKWVT
jgi:hypothetical protein